MKNKVLELVQAWSHGFRNEPSYRIVQDTYNAMRMEGLCFLLCVCVCVCVIGEREREGVRIFVSHSGQVVRLWV